ncbi:MAG TPA: DUF6261 family protein [Dysgonamonadaceae bacterium]|nr:DUF6261 family protein [Dysgonamonadaceae bacterium]
MDNNFSSGWLILLHNDEYPVLFEQICFVMDKYKLDDERVNEAAARVKSHLEPLKQVKVRSLRHELTPAIRELHSQRKQSLMSLKGQIHSLTLSTVPEERQAADVLDIWLGKHRGQLLSLGYIPLTEHVNEIIADAETDANVSGALAALSLMPIVEKLKAINEAFKTLSVQRRDELSQTDKVDAKAIRQAADKDLRLMLGLIEANAQITGNEAYQPLIQALKKFLDYYRILVQSRKTRRVTEKNSKIKVSKQETVIQTNPVTESA